MSGGAVMIPEDLAELRQLFAEAWPDTAPAEPVPEPRTPMDLLRMWRNQNG